MSRSIGYCALMIAAALVLMCAIAAQNVLSDLNEFLRHFVNQELLSILAVILSITLASTAQIHLEFNKIEERYQKRNALVKTRRGVKTAAFCLIFLFLMAVLVVVLKPLLANAAWSQTIFNGTALIILLWDILILAELTMTVFGITPIIKDDG